MTDVNCSTTQLLSPPPSLKYTGRLSLELSRQGTDGQGRRVNCAMPVACVVSSASGTEWSICVFGGASLDESAAEVSFATYRL